MPGVDFNGPYGSENALNRSEREVTRMCDTHVRRWCVWMLLAVTFLNAGSMIGLTAMDLVRTVGSDNQQMAIDIGVLPDRLPEIPIYTYNMSDPSFTFDIIIFLTVVLMLIFMLRGLIGEKKFEVCLCPLIFTVAFVYCVVEYVANSEHNNGQKLARLIVGGTLLLLSYPLTALSVSETTWPEFQIIGASDGLMGMYRQLRFFLSLLKFDFYIMLFLAVLNLKNGVNSSLTEDVPKIVAVVLYAFLYLIVGSESVKREKKPLVYLFIGLALILPVWVPLQVMMYNCMNLECEKRVMLITSTAVSIGIIGISTRCYVLMQLLAVFRNFGYGLTDTAFAGLIAGESTSLLGRPRRGY